MESQRYLPASTAANTRLNLGLSSNDIKNVRPPTGLAVGTANRRHTTRRENILAWIETPIPRKPEPSGSTATEPAVAPVKNPSRHPDEPGGREGLGWLRRSSYRRDTFNPFLSPAPRSATIRGRLKNEGGENGESSSSWHVTENVIRSARSQAWRTLPMSGELDNYIRRQSC
ncbi:hypothetical protein LSH36_995g01077 [Paralvinella palmiformis]|uniref:Uncharacterized protein n=1 Tax=Paralvinella palmiformis TaxID=53620 RepID=A0AAD9IWY5_9ANNE|nr:hypothetical protein LSH36_995g01077 [Paralvinella palmiformis]